MSVQRKKKTAKEIFNAGGTDDLVISERPGTKIGPYKLLQEIGEGGFGVVYMAEQVEPVRRKVALKIIKPGMDTKQVVARFEAERQALALMDHPNIAKVLDAGSTESGRPYFVMELVKGGGDYGILRQEQLEYRRTPRPVCPDLSGRATCTPERRHSSRPKAEQRYGDASRRASRAESD
jgi:serine/threonine protein kinase